MKLSQILFSQGFGTRREVAGLLAHSLVSVAGRVVEDGDEPFATEGLVVTVEGRAWPFHERALLLLHKPVGYECSTKPKAWPSVLSLLPTPLRNRGVQCVGRLDQDTTGVLLLTDEGTWIHRLTSPKWHVPKTYDVRTARPVLPAQIEALLAGVVLNDDPVPVRAAAACITGECALQLVLTEGKYHQVKRMVAAVGNHVEALHRSAFGDIKLQGGARMPETDLAPGQWRWLDPDELPPGVLPGRKAT